MDPNAYYNQLIEQGIAPDEAAQMVRSQFPDFLPPSGMGGPTDPNPPPPVKATPPPAPTLTPDGSAPPTGVSTTPNPGESIDAFLIRLLNGGMGRDQAIAAAGQSFGFSAGQDGYPAWYPDNGTIGLKGGYLTLENGVWKYTTRGPEGPGANGFQIDPSYLRPFTDAVPKFAPPGAFQAPTKADLEADPSYQFRRDQTMDVYQKGQAAKGLYHSGGTIYDLGNLASQFAGTEYGNVFNRKFGIWDTDWRNALSTNSAGLQDYQTARDTFYANQTNPFSKLRDIYSIGANAAGVAG